MTATGTVGCVGRRRVVRRGRWRWSAGKAGGFRRRGMRGTGSVEGVGEAPPRPEPRTRPIVGAERGALQDGLGGGFGGGELVFHNRAISSGDLSTADDNGNWEELQILASAAAWAKRPVPREIPPPAGENAERREDAKFWTKKWAVVKVGMHTPTLTYDHP